MKKHLNPRANIALGLVFAFLANFLGPLPAQADSFILPAPGQMVPLSPAYFPVVLKGIKLDPNNPFRFHFFVDTGNSRSTREQLKTESTLLIKYFLASLTIPEQDLWVNLSPYEKNSIVPMEFGQTIMGRDLLAQDYMLKEITASLIYPEDKIGHQFWQKVYAQAQAKYGTTNIPINTFNKVWIVPDKAVVYENNGAAFVLESHLKVMLEEDYVSLQKHTSSSSHSLASNIIRQLVLPQLEHEVNYGKNFSQLRQVFYSLILATWYKKKIKDSILNKIYSNRNIINGVNVPATDKDKIYQEYLKAFKKGVFDYIKEQPGGMTGQFIPRKYFSGGLRLRVAVKILRPGQINRAQLANLAQSSSLVDISGQWNAAMKVPLTEDYQNFVLSTLEDNFKQGISGLRAKVGEFPEKGFDQNYLLAFSIYGYLYAKQLARSIKSSRQQRPMVLVLAQDPRPSGPAVRDALVRGFLASVPETKIPIKTIDIGIFTTPMAESAVRTFKADGGAIITASHNPLEYNGIKFMTSWQQQERGAAQGALLGEDTMGELVNKFQSIRNSERQFGRLRNKLVAIQYIPPARVKKKVFDQVREGYYQFILSEFPHGLDTLNNKKMIIDSNGGAAAGRLLEKDMGHVEWLFTKLGMKVTDLNKQLGKPHHAIEPSVGSKGLTLMAEYLKSSGNMLGKVFDFDADRAGDDSDPQTTAALNVAITLSWMDAYHMADDRNVVVVVHDATSMKVNAIAQLFSRPGRTVSVRRVETGEINVVSAMQEERRKGNYVPIGVEGANGGTVFMNSTCRDGVISGILKAFALFDPKVYYTWTSTLLRSGRSVAGRTIENSLPESNRKTELGSINAAGDALLKARMEDNFKTLWKPKNAPLKQMYSDYQVLHYEGTVEKKSLTPGKKGGWRIELTKKNGKKDFIWVRMSRTEPIMRYLVDAQGNHAFNLLKQTLLSISGQHDTRAMKATPGPLEDDDSLVSGPETTKQQAMSSVSIITLLILAGMIYSYFDMEYQNITQIRQLLKKLSRSLSTKSTVAILDKILFHLTRFNRLGMSYRMALPFNIIAQLDAYCLNLMDEDNTEIKLATMRIMDKIAYIDYIKLLVPYLSSEEPSLRSQAFFSIAEIFMINRSERQKLINSLGASRDTLVELLIEHMDKTTEIDENMLILLEYLNDPRTIAPLIKIRGILNKMIEDTVQIETKVRLDQADLIKLARRIRDIKRGIRSVDATLSKIGHAPNSAMINGPGGIDLNPAQMSMQVNGQGNDLQPLWQAQALDAAQAVTNQGGGVTSITFSIETMTPVSNLPQILGMNMTAIDNPFQTKLAKI